MTYTKEREDEINRALEVVLNALEQGEIEERCTLLDEPLWRTPVVGKFTFGGFSCEYRAKPAMLEGYVNVYERSWSPIHPTKHDAEAAAYDCATRVAVKVREVQE